MRKHCGWLSAWHYGINQGPEDLPRPRPELRIEIMPDGEEAPWSSIWDGTLFYPPQRTRDLAHRLVRTLSQHNARMILREADVYAIALRHLEEDQRLGDAAMGFIKWEVSLRENNPEDS